MEDKITNNLENTQIYVSITDETINPSESISFVDDADNGAIATFLGVVRAKNMGRDVKGIDYDAFAPLAENIFREICSEAREKWGQELKIHLVHFKGYLPVGGISVSIAVSSPHRDESYSASRYIIEELKDRAPIWKKEYYIDGESDWVKGHALCQHAPL